MIAGLVFRRNLAAEISLFSPQKQPDTVVGWFTLLQTHRLLGLAYLNIFDLVNYVLVSLMFLALYAALSQAYKSTMTIAITLGLLGIAVYLATNTAFSLLALSDQYAAAASEAQRALLLPAGQALLALNRFSSPGANPGSGGYLSLLLVAAAGMLASLAMLRSGRFGRVTAWVGIAACGLDLTYCLVYVFSPSTDAALLAVLFIPAAGLFYMIWHILVGWKLLRAGQFAGGQLHASGVIGFIAIIRSHERSWLVWLGFLSAVLPALMLFLIIATA